MKAIAIDGPSGAGKSTAARAAAKQLGYLYVDTGAMYRAIGCRLRAMGVSQNEEEEVARALEGLKLTLSFEGGDQHVFVNGEDMTGVIRTPDASRAASDFSKLPCVRQFLFRSGDTARIFALYDVCQLFRQFRADFIGKLFVLDDIHGDARINISKYIHIYINQRVNFYNILFTHFTA